MSNYEYFQDSETRRKILDGMSNQQVQDALDVGALRVRGPILPSEVDEKVERIRDLEEEVEELKESLREAERMWDKYASLYRAAKGKLEDFNSSIRLGVLDLEKDERWSA